jgi:hypothetical protein
MFRWFLAGLATREESLICVALPEAVGRRAKQNIGIPPAACASIHRRVWRLVLQFYTGRAALAIQQIRIHFDELFAARSVDFAFQASEAFAMTF